jgi:hypothetical protein
LLTTAVVAAAAGAFALAAVAVAEVADAVTASANMPSTGLEWSFRFLTHNLVRCMSHYIGGIMCCR